MTTTTTTSLLTIAVMLTGVGGSLLSTDLWVGVVVLLIAGGLIILRDKLKVG
jgi:hypothetical protein